MKFHWILAVAAESAMLALSSPASAAELSFVTTRDAVYWRSPSNADVVQWFPRLKTTLTPVLPSPPGVERWRAAVVLNKPIHPDVAALNPSWARKVLVPFVVTPTKECSLTRDPSMHFVTQEVFASGRDVGAADASPVCAFTLRLPTENAEAALALMQASANAETLIMRSIRLTVPTVQSVGWSELQSPLALLLAGAAPVTHDEALFLVGVVSGQNADVASALKAAGPAARYTFGEQAVRTLFSGNADGLVLEGQAVGGAYDLAGPEVVYDL